MVTNHLQHWTLTCNLKSPNWKGRTPSEPPFFRFKMLNLPGCTSQLGWSLQANSLQIPPVLPHVSVARNRGIWKTSVPKTFGTWSQSLEVNHHGGSFWMMINPYQSYYKNGGFANYPLNNGGWKGNARFQKRTPWVVLMPLELGWWFRSPARKPPVIYQTLQKMGYSPYQLVQDFFHPQFHLFCGSGRSLFWAAPCHVEGDHFWELCGNL